MEKKKTAVSEDPVEGFSQIVLILAAQMGIVKIPNVNRYVELLVQECDRHTFEIQTGVSPLRKLEKDKRTFITVFKTRHLQCMDLEYDRQITGVDANYIRQICKGLSEKGFTVDEFLRWFFDIYLADNPKLCPPNIKLTCSALVWQKFLYEHRVDMKERERKKLAETEGYLLVNRGRALMRQATESGKAEFKEKVKTALMKYSEGCIINELRKDIENLEQETQTWATQA